MKRIVPAGYRYKSTGITLGIAALAGFAFIAWRFREIGASDSDIHLVAAFAGVVAALFMLSDVIANLARVGRISRMKYMLEQRSVSGEITEIESIAHWGGKELTDNQAEHIRKTHYFYRMHVSFYNPVSGRQEELVSERYKSDLGILLENREAVVYCAPDGSAWAEPACFRKSLSSSSVSGGDSPSARAQGSFVLMKYAAPVVLAGTLIPIAALLLFVKFFIIG